ncbi:MAG TPA: RNA 2',3'-cyclic phosphodiesterase [Gemmatimonadales bacterium]|nr:RNA 2',3'-cyclic phosphodiesterase [Gemmatimonadales bacterium]
MRLFVALNFPEAVKHGLWEAASPVRARPFPVRWVPRESIHLTVKFLGEVTAAELPAVREALGRTAAGSRALVLTIAGFGVFPNARAPRVVWAGLEPDPALELLHHDAERAFEPLGFTTDGRPFRPHVTLGRTRSARAGEFAALSETLASLQYESTVRIEALDLMESLPGASGVTYHLRYGERLS